MAKTRKITSTIADSKVTLTFGELGEISLRAADVPEGIREDLLLFACKQKVTNATGGSSLEDAFEEGKAIFQNILDGNIKAVRETSAKTAIAKKSKGLSAEKQAQVLALIEQLMANE
jgi:hypothetical protein